MRNSRLTADECRWLAGLLVKSAAQDVLQPSAVDELEGLVAQRIQAHPGETRQVAVGEIFRANPGLYERVRRETTFTRQGVTLSEAHRRRQSAPESGVGPVSAEVERRVSALVAKSANLTRAQACHMVFERDPELYEKWRRETYA